MIEPSYFWTNIFLLALGTLAIRGTFIAMSSRVKISDRWRQIFSFIPVAILPAFVAPAVFFHQGHQALLFGKERFFVLVASTAVCFFSKSTLATIAFGLVALYLLNR
jgi:branched-subunit amino acid transport protein